jgi:hypothetical protein
MAYCILQSHSKPSFAAAAATLHLDGPHRAIEALNELPLVRREEAWLADGYRVWRRRDMFGA